MVRAGLLAAGACLITLSAQAEQAKRPFRIAAGPAAGAIAEFAKQADLRVLADGDELAGVRTNPVGGLYRPSRALQLLLKGTRLQASMAPNGTVLIKQGPPPAPPPPQRDEPARVEVTGTRASQQSAIERKKNADTARDSIVAEDVGAFPDRNAAEAISRIAGLTLDRGDYGEGSTVNVRGITPEFTRVEIDGIGVQAAGGTDLNNGGSGRGVDLRELSTDLIKSIDVVKGATAAMTEGSLGGAILIRTRTGLDFDKRYLSLRVAGQHNSINERWTPNLNLVFADRFLDKRLGVVLNLTRTEARNENHTMFVSSRDIGMSRSIDYDQSPEKTFSYNPATVSTSNPAATAPLASWARAGGGSVDAYSPLEIVSRSAAARTKADCYAAFPRYSSTELASIASSSNRTIAQNQRSGELLSCLNQWNDYTPQNPRYQMRRQYDRRLYGDLRFDVKASDDLSLYAKFNRNTRRISDDQLFFTQGAIATNADGSFADSGAAPAIMRSALPGYYWYPSPVNLGTAGGTYRGLTNGSVVNIDPSSVKVDANHHVTQYTLSNASVLSDQLYDQIQSRSQYAQLGGSWRSGALRAEFLAGRARADAWRMQWRTGFAYRYGASTVSLAPDGLWTYTLPADVAISQKDPNHYGLLQSPADARLPATSAATPLIMTNGRIMERGEDVARLDLTYAVNDAVPVVNRIKFGLSRRGNGQESYTGSGYTVKPADAAGPAVVVPRVAIGSNYQACEDTPGSLAPGGTPCQYGIRYSTSPATAFNSTIVMHQADYRNIVAQAMTRDTITYFNSLPNRPATLPQGWAEIDVRKVIEGSGVQHFNLDCIKFCTGNDGKVYEQPRSAVSERITSAYVSADLNFGRLPFDWELNGNIGWRLVRTSVAATGLMTFQSIMKTAAYNPANPNAAAGISMTALARNTALQRSSTDVMPVLNLAWWPLRDRLAVRLNRAKVIARPPVEYLYSNGVSCTRDERKLAGGEDGDTPDMACNGTLGNPGLRAQSNRNTNLALEWYPSRDTLLSLALFRQKGIVGPAQRVAVTNARPFAGSGAVDPATGRDLSEVEYAYTTYANGPATDRRGVELSGKTAFTALPSLLRHTGLEMNYTRVRSNNLEAAVRELISGDPMRPIGELRYTWNASLWYDDGKWRARIALQSAAAFFRGLTGMTNSYPANGIVGGTGLPYNPASPTFQDARRFLDAKVSYRFANGIELFAEGRNIGRVTVTASQGGYQPFADGTPNLLDYAYAGAQYMVGITLRH